MLGLTLPFITLVLKFAFTIMHALILLTKAVLKATRFIKNKKYAEIEGRQMQKEKFE